MKMWRERLKGGPREPVLLKGGMLVVGTTSTAFFLLPEMTETRHSSFATPEGFRVLSSASRTCLRLPDDWRLQ